MEKSTAKHVMRRTLDPKDVDTVKEQELWFTLNDSPYVVLKVVNNFKIMIILHKGKKLII